jgi:hypothetical protein
MCSRCFALQIEIDGEGYVVTSLVLRYKVSKPGRPQRLAQELCCSIKPSDTGRLQSGQQALLGSGKATQSSMLGTL